MADFKFWGTGLAGFIALGWLLPNHYVPWIAFHVDAWMAVVLWSLAGLCLVKWRGPVPLTVAIHVIAALCFVPLLQWWLGQVKFLGTASVGAAYLLGLLLAVLTGIRWHANRPGELLDILFIAIAVAATISVAFQICQWLRLDDGCFCGSSWIAKQGESSRISANLGQPNQLATLLVWGILAYGWAWQRAKVRGAFAFVGAAFLLIGLALTQSRTGALALGVVFLGTFFWRRLLAPTLSLKAVVALALYFLVVVLGLPVVSDFLLIGYSSNILARTQGETRIDAWLMFLNAVWNQPLAGYGWDQTLLAQISLTTVVPGALATVGAYFAHTHNLFLDLVIWFGIPVGGALSLGIVWWVVRSIKGVMTGQGAMALLLVLTVGLHAMLELPLHYAYFLLPLGLVVGTLEASNPTKIIGVVGHKAMVGLFLIAALLLGLIIKDYLKVEESYNELRLEHNRIMTSVPRTPPDVIVLTQLRDFIVVSRLEPSPDLSAQQMRLIEDVTLVYPTAENLVKMAAVFVYQRRALEAQLWLNRICQVSDKGNCAWAKMRWQRLQAKYKPLQSVAWQAVDR